MNTWWQLLMYPQNFNQVILQKDEILLPKQNHRFFFSLSIPDKWVTFFWKHPYFHNLSKWWKSLSHKLIYNIQYFWISNHLGVQKVSIIEKQQNKSYLLAQRQFLHSTQYSFLDLTDLLHLQISIVLYYL